MKRVAFLFFVFILLTLFASAQRVEPLALYRFASSIGLPWEVNDFNEQLAQWSRSRSFSEHYSLNPMAAVLQLGADSLPIPDSLLSQYNLSVAGSFDSLNGKEALTLIFFDAGENRLFKKEIPLFTLEKEMVLELVCMKIRSFMQESWLSTLEIKTVPLETPIRINGFLAGNGPLELTLPKGNYTVQLGKDYFAPLVDSIVLAPGTRVSKEYRLKFEGFNIRPPLYAAAALSVLAIVFKVRENSLHDDYQNLRSGLPQSTYDDKFGAYRTMNVLSLTSINLASIFYGITAYGVIKNHDLKKSLLK